MESSTPVLISQLKGKPTKQRYRATKIFLDHYIDLTYIHWQKLFSSEEMVEAKKAFEVYAQMCKVKVKHYHADYGRLVDNTFQQSVTQEIQTTSYCRVNAHFQNGKAGKRIRDLQEQTRKQLHHVKGILPSAVELALWTFSLRQETHLKNCLPDKLDASYKLKRFPKTSVSPNPR